MTTTVFVPCDSSAVSVGADEVARRIADEARSRKADVKIVRNGSRGMFWLEPMVEVATAAGRIAYGPVGERDVKGLFDSSFLEGGAHALRVGKPEDHPYLKKQTRVTFARAGITDPVSLEEYVANGGYRGLKKALAMSGEQIVEEVTRSGLRGRGGAAFPTGIKWKTVLAQAATPKYVACNADEGDSGSFSDRMLMEGDPFTLIEGMTIAAVAVGAQRGYVYLRSEYPTAKRIFEEALVNARQGGWLGASVAGSGKPFDIEVRVGAGSYICGEETAMLESLEGKRGMVRAKPPLPAIVGLFGQPTVVNNVITFGSVPAILDKGADHYQALGTGRSRGTLPMQLAGNVKHGGLVEVPFGVTLRELLHDYGGGSASGRPIKAVQVGGPLGAYLAESEFDIPLDYEAYAAKSAMVGHGGIVVFDDSANMAGLARYAMEFCAIESCGKCTPCRIGSTRGVEVIERIVANKERQANVVLLRDLCDTMVNGSLCALGGLTPYPVLSAVDKFPKDFGL
jgi:formate dehydrogenase iron-sulfur subunit